MQKKKEGEKEESWEDAEYEAGHDGLDGKEKKREESS